MLKIIQFLWHGCWHDWKFLGSGTLVSGTKTVGQYYAYQCSKCSRIEERGMPWGGV